MHLKGVLKHLAIRENRISFNNQNPEYSVIQSIKKK